MILQSNVHPEDAGASGQGSAKAAQATWAWARQWEFWLALLLAAVLRFWRLDLTQFLDDQTGLMTLARTATTHGLIPLTGIPSSIHTLNPPLSIYLLLPFTAFTANPMPIVISIALWNVLGVALCYIFTLRYFGRRVAAVSALLFATCGAAINYSRFIWQQNYLPPLLILWALTLYLGCVEGRRRWFAGHVTLLALAALLHPTAALLAPVTLVGVALAPSIPRMRAWVISAVVLLALALPTLIWEALSGFSDLHAARTYALGHSQINLAVLYYLYQALGGGPASATGAVGVSFTALNVIATALFAIGWLALTARVVGPARSLDWRRDAGAVAAARAWLVALVRGLRADSAWRINLLLWLSVTVPTVLMVRHSGGLFAHYLMVLYPTGFIVSAVGAVVTIAWVASLVERRGAQLASATVLALEAALLALIIARSAQWLSYPLTLTDTKTFNAYHDYGYPLSVLQGGSATLTRLQAQTGAEQVEVITAADPRYRLPENFILANEQANRVALTPNCLALPPETSKPWLVTTVFPNTPAETLLPRLGNVGLVGTLPMVGGPTYPVYQVRGAAPSLPGEIQLAPSTFTDQHGDTLRLVSASLPTVSALLLRWQIVTASAPADQTRQFRVTASANGASAYVDCDAQRWQPGETLFTWIPLSAAAASDLSVRVETTTQGLAMPSAWGLSFLSDAPVGGVFSPAPPTAGPAGVQQAQVTVSADGSLTIPAGVLTPVAK